ncbi:alpha/beta hydrolase [Fluviibacterium sp. DFM31]|uniref:Alpha/beta hydrolase n=1 Tax=Meridianimarinicoccus marinus TaxID=3231483 RepID=A0ABV3L3A4_9RHOB
MLFVTNRVPDEGLKTTLGRNCTFSPANNAVCNATFFCRREASGATVEIGSAALFQALKDAKADHILFFIHGFNTSPKAALNRAAQLQEFCDRKEKDKVLVLPFLWPTDDDSALLILNDYVDDRHSAQLSGGAFARVLAKLIAMSGDPAEFEKKFSVCAHSMGNRVLRETLLFWKEAFLVGAVPEVFQHTFLTAADIPCQDLEFGQEGEIIAQASRNVVVYYADSDLALKASALVNHQPNALPRRLGTAGPRAMSRVADWVFSLDCSAVARKYDKKRGHVYFLNSHSGKTTPGKVAKHMINTLLMDEVLADALGFRTGRLS